MTREQARNILRNAAWLGTNEDRERIERAVELLCGESCEELPSVTPKQRTGHWIKNGETDENGNAEYMCSECTHGDVHAETQIVPFCWWCGTRMVEPQESEEA